MRRFAATQADEGRRLDVVVAELAKVSRTQAQQWLRDGSVTAGAGNRSGRPGQLVKAGDKITVSSTATSAVPKSQPQVLNLPIVYEDADMLVIDKPPGLAVHPASPADLRASVADFSRTRTSDPDSLRPGIVHRLDAGTSGLLILAKHPVAKAYLQRQFAERKVSKSYLALLMGRIEPSEALIRLPIGRSKTNPTKSEVATTGRTAETTYKTIAVYSGYSLVEAHPQTGRTHQLRVHFAALGHPVVGDTRYGQPKIPAGLTRQFLHAAELALASPSGKTLHLHSPLPPDLAAFVANLSAKAEAKHS